MILKIRKLIEELNQSGVRYCHWKSNFALAETVAGQTDVDLLVDRKEAAAFKKFLAQLDFRPAEYTYRERFPSTEHYYALDETTGILVHVHVYFQVITGGSLSKNYRLPLEEMLLQNTRELDSLRIPTGGAELVIFTLRMMLKHISLIELLLLAREWKHVKDEIDWLCEGDAIVEAASLVANWVPPLEANLFSACVMALKSPSSIQHRIRLAYRMRSRLHVYKRHSDLRAWLSGAWHFIIMLRHRMTRSSIGMVPLSGGAVIAFVGPEATGKSTLLSNTNDWLGEHFAVTRIHAGKPPATILSAIPSLLLPFFRSLLPSLRPSRIDVQSASDNQPEESRETYPLLSAIRAVLLAYDRRSLLARAFRQAANGRIVLCDRYPSMLNGAPDSPVLLHLSALPGRYSIRRWLARLEEQLYRGIPPPDLILYLSVPLEIAMVRNQTRGKTEPEDYVRVRHAQSSNLNFGHIPVCKINTDQPLSETVLEVKNTVWNAL